MAVPYSVQTAISWGEMIKIVYDMFEANKNEINPAQPPHFPSDWQVVANLTMEPVFGIFEKTEFIGFVVQSTNNPTDFGIVYRGTSGVLEWLDDFESGKVPFTDVVNGGEVEDGFLKMYNSIRAIPHGETQSVSLQQYLETLAPMANLVVTGHSLGGSLAILNGAVVANLRSDLNLELYTFAAPMVGNQAFVTMFNAHVPASYRIYNEPDIVPHVPIGLFGYEQVNSGIEVNSLLYPNLTRSISAYHSLDTYLYLLNEQLQAATVSNPTTTAQN